MDLFYVGQSVKIVRSNGAIQTSTIFQIDGHSGQARVTFCGPTGERLTKIVTFGELLQANPALNNKRRRLNVTHNIVDDAFNLQNSMTPRRHSVFVENNKIVEKSIRLTECSNKTRPSSVSVVGNSIRVDVDRRSRYYEYNKLMTNEESSMIFIPLTYKISAFHKKMEVFIRVRPLNIDDVKAQEIRSLAIPDAQSLVMFMPQVKIDLKKYVTPIKFKFDAVFNESADNECVYNVSCRHLVDNFFDFGHSTCFAYGQTGSGKTYTMYGASKKNKIKGMYALAATDVFKHFTTKGMERSGYSICCAYFEIYMNKAYDLLNLRKELRVQADEHDQVQISGLTKIQCRSPLNVLEVLKKGSSLRSCGKTKANKDSSRSHAIFQFILMRDKSTISKLCLVDLAGNERGADSGDVDKNTRNEGNAINKSLLALKECIRQMSSGSADRIPFRNSALTQFLKDSFIGEKSKLCMITTISPAISNCEVTLNSLKYAEQVMKIKNISSSISSISEGIDEEDMEVDDDAFAPEQHIQEYNHLSKIEELKRFFHECLFELEDYKLKLRCTDNRSNFKSTEDIKNYLIEKLNCI
uniref:Kinesin-like protein n=1 Tax=Parastrongyloides trichosuri TaxID=131310 RepID=A0A0N4ZRT6_PARTI